MDGGDSSTFTSKTRSKDLYICARGHIHAKLGNFSWDGRKDEPIREMKDKQKAADKKTNRKKYSGMNQFIFS